MARKLAGRRILLVEDSPVVSDFAGEVLRELGCEVVGPATNMASARELAQRSAADAAIVDLHIRGDKSFPICEILASRGIPFVLTSGYADWSVPEKLQGRPRLPKPYTLGDVESALRKLFN